MSATFHMVSRPPKWISAHRKNEFVYNVPEFYISTLLNNSGFVQINVAYNGVGVAVGSRIFVLSGTYAGFHTVRSIEGGNLYTLNTVWTTDDFSAPLGRLCNPPFVTIYKGYQQGELIFPLYPSGTLDLYDIMPETLIATFSPEIDTDGYVRFDISGYVKSALENPYRAGYNADETSYIYAMSATQKWIPKNYVQVRIEIEGNTEARLLAANASVSSQELNRYYVSTGQQLQPLLRPVSYFGTDEVGDYIRQDGFQVRQ